MFPFFLCHRFKGAFMFKDLTRFLFFILPRVVLTGLEGLIFNEITICGYEFNYYKRQNKKQIEQKILANYLKKCHKKTVEDDKKNNGKTQGNG